MNFQYAARANEESEALEMAEFHNGIYKLRFRGEIREMQHSANVLQELHCHLPKEWETDLDLTGAPID